MTGDAGRGVSALDLVPGDELRVRLRSCCAADAWVEAVMGGRPYASEAELLAESDRATAELDAAGLAQALAGHPRIGDKTAAAHGSDGRSAAWSRGEQAGVTGAATGLLDELAAANAAYEERFGHVYLVCASGRGADELLAVCRARLGNDPATERGVVLEELAKINQLRLTKLLGEER
ncbi:MAG TPA: 2-oxo-4-hydroxy-4-carboxy-5-ureidoimidazoline decarboxylase [Solirubrobacteraceae bacterium]|jgi:2-oxo-4-hydroxy-4-carboxy-5-ureidoimidazoline decarboxylase